MPAAEQITDPVAYHGEGPCWSPTWGGLRWVDMLAGDVLRLEANGQVGRRHVGTVAAALRPCADGGMLVARESDVVLLLGDPDDGDASDEARVVARIPVGGNARLNEGGCDPQGRFYVGSLRYDFRTGGGQLYRVDLDGTVSVVLPEVTISNGLEWSPDGSLAYYADTPTRRVDVFDHDPTSGPVNRRPLVGLRDGVGNPDGLTVDAEGGIWVALYGGSAVHRYTPDGRLDEVVALPVRQVTACTFGGDDLGELYVTTSRENLGADAEPGAGALYRCRPGVSGLPVRPFRGIADPTTTHPTTTEEDPA
jgi:sugar lactone lactonase YvrE